MKKLILSVAFAAIAFGASAQEYGVKAGLNLANITNVEDSKMKPSFYVGGFVTFKVSDFWSVQPELIYSRQGYMFKEGDDKLWDQYDYINLPVLAKIDLIDGLTLDLGPQFGYLVSARWKEKVGGETESGTIDSDEINKFDVSAAMGLTYKICKNIEASARYNLGLTDIAKDNQSDDKFKNNVIQIGLGYRF